VTQVVDDIDGKVLREHETVTYAVDGINYEFDASPKHARQFRNDLEMYVQASRRVAGAPTRTKRPTETSADRRLIREWAAANGYDLATRGRIPAEVREAYRSPQ
jgi:hypothetical protein